MTAPGIDLDAEALNSLAQRRAAPHLAIGFLVAVAALFELLAWEEVSPSHSGTRQWRPARAVGEDVRATLRPANGGTVDPTPAP